MNAGNETAAVKAYSERWLRCFHDLLSVADSAARVNGLNPEKVGKYYDLMKEFVYRTAWDAPRDHEVEFAIYSHGVAEQMPVGRISQSDWLDDWLLIVFHSSAACTFGGRTIQLEPGEAMIWAPGQKRDYGNDAEPWAHSWLQFSGSRVKALLESFEITPAEPWEGGQPEVVELGLRRLHEEATSYDSVEPRILGNLFENWLLDIRRSKREGDAGSGVEARLRVLKRRLDMELDKTVSLVEMGSWAGMSPSHLISCFKACFGESPVSYHISRRIDLARFLLTNRNMSVGEVGTAVGYEELPSFSRTFKRVVGMGPREYRARAGGA